MRITGQDLHVSVMSCRSDRLKADAFFWQQWECLPYPQTPHFFASQKTLQAWLGSLGEDVVWVSCLHDVSEKIIGMAIFGEHETTVARVFTCRTLSLLRRGVADKDQVWPEYVMPKCHPEQLENIGFWFSETLKKTNCTKIETQVIPSSWLADWSRCAPSNIRVCSENPEKGYSKSLLDNSNIASKSIKRQINQTNRYALSRWGQELSMREVLDIEALDNIRQAADWHVQKWSETDTPSGFANPFFSSVLNEWVKSGSARVFSAYSGDTMLGVTIVLDDKPWAGFYLACIPDFDSNHWHIGVWMHTIVMKLLKEDGYTVYDFMAGEARYKKQLSDIENDYVRGVWVDKSSLQGLLIWWLISSSLDGNIIK